MSFHLTPADARVLGALVEKEITTPEYYPLSLNALVNACNQKSNRDPVMSLDEAAVRESLRSLGELALARSASSEGRVAKFEHRLQEAFNFTRPEAAIVCELLLRGTQTPGELRNRAGRMHPFEDLAGVHSTLQRLINREPPLVRILPTQPGAKEARYTQLLSGEVETGAAAEVQRESSASGESSPSRDRVEQVEAVLRQLQQEILDLKAQFAQFRKQFE